MNSEIGALDAPSKLLHEVRQLAALLRRRDPRGYDYELAERFQELDQWMSHGNPRPAPWAFPNPEGQKR